MNKHVLFKFKEITPSDKIVYYFLKKASSGELFAISVDNDMYYDTTLGTKEVDIKDESYIISYYQVGKTIFPCIYEMDNYIVIIDEDMVKIWNKNVIGATKTFMIGNIKTLSKLK